MKEKVIFWFRNDLRLNDNINLQAAATAGTVIPVYILNQDKKRPLGEASLWWLKKSLQSLNQSLDYKLNFYSGDPVEIIHAIAKIFDVKKVFFHESFEPEQKKIDEKVIQSLKKENIECFFENSTLLWHPEEVLKSDGTFYKVFTPFFNACLKSENKPQKSFKIANLSCKKDDESGLVEKISSYDFGNTWQPREDSLWEPGEESAHKKLVTFLKNNVSSYQVGRDYPAQQSVSRLSPHLRFGEISPNQIWEAASLAMEKHSGWKENLHCFKKELCWREFSYYFLYHFPKMPQQNYQQSFDYFPWQENKKMLQAWQNGETGYPIIDAGMKELRTTGYMHNRVRMIVGSFLVKNLQIHWRHGEAWFWNYLVDADLASNSFNWQWVAGTGADAAPYFRIFNPITQSEKFDEEGKYIKKFLPQLQKIPAKYLHNPSAAPREILQHANVVLDSDYPRPIVDLATSREIALASFKKLKS